MLWRGNEHNEVCSLKFISDAFNKVHLVSRALTQAYTGTDLPTLMHPPQKYRRQKEVPC